MKPHCPTCQCEPKTGFELTVYPPNEILYGRCETCGQVRWGTEMFSLRYRSQSGTTHCGCCTHAHDLPPGGHHITDRERLHGRD
jgi:hypothetical protein